MGIPASSNLAAHNGIYPGMIIVIVDVQRWWRVLGAGIAARLGIAGASALVGSAICGYHRRNWLGGGIGIMPYLR